MKFSRSSTNFLPDLVPLADAAIWLSRQVGYAVSSEYIVELGNSERFELESESSWIGEPVGFGDEPLAEMMGKGKRDLHWYIRREDLQALSLDLKAEPKPDDTNALSAASYDTIIGVMRELLIDHGYRKDTALMQAIQSKASGKRGVSDRTLRTAFSRAKDALKT